MLHGEQESDGRRYADEIPEQVVEVCCAAGDGLQEFHHHAEEHCGCKKDGGLG